MHPMVRRSMDKSKKRGFGPLSGENSGAKTVRPRFSKLNSSDCASTDMQEDSLPSDIQERVVALLSLPNIFQLRCVCKRWNAWIHCARFQELSVRSWGPFYMPFIRWRGIGPHAIAWFAYNLAERKRIRMPRLEFPSLNGYSEWSLVTSNGGLVCFGSEDAQRTLVGNPLTNKWKELPPWKLDNLIVASVKCLIVDKERNSYKILFAGNPEYNYFDPRYGMVNVYDSMTNMWSVGQSMSAGNAMKTGAYCSGGFYVLTERSQRSPYAVVILDLTTLRWREETIPVPRRFRHGPCIVACLDQIYLVGRRNDIGKYKVANVFVYDLDESNSWTEVSEYPDRHLLGISMGITACTSNGSKIHVGVHSSKVWVLVYDCATRCWEEPIYREDAFDCQDIIPKTKFTFQPNIQAAP